MEITDVLRPNDINSLGLLGYLITLDDQVHSYQMSLLEDYLSLLGLTVENTCLDSIIRGSDVTVSYNTAIEAFSKESIDFKIQLLSVIYRLSYADNHYDESEEELIKDVLGYIDEDKIDIPSMKKQALDEANLLREQNNIEFLSHKKKVSFWISLWQKIVLFFCRLFHKESKYETRTNEDYKKAIEKCSVIANEDLSLVAPEYRNNISECENTIRAIKSYRRSLSLETGLSANVAAAIGRHVDELDEKVMKQVKRESESLEQKKRTVSDFTISLIGRTKAGKSTLHAILTEQGKDRIGCGKQRTTRYNWIYQWNLLRIIDTPGIGSAEADGRKDEEIASSVLGESDILCFVVVDDSILKDILEFIKRIAELNKPIIILLNHKENIRPEVKFKRHISNPKQWLIETGESNLKGHEERIRKYADENGFGELVNVYPVFLLAALMAGEPQYEEYKDVLWESSNIDVFIDNIKSWILSSGYIKRSQTILDESIGVFKKASDNVRISETVIKDQISFLENDRKTKMEDLRSASEDVVIRLREKLTDLFDDLATNKATEFSEMRIGRKDDINEKWAAYIKSIGFEDTVKEAIEEEINIYKDKADRTVVELFEDLLYHANLSFKMNNIDIPIQFDIKSFVRLATSAVSVAGGIILMILESNPVGWVLTISAGIVGIISGFLFKSKEQRRMEASQKIYSSVNEAIEKEAPSQINSIIKTVTEDLNDNVNIVDNVFTDLISGLKKTLAMSDNLIDRYSDSVDHLNKIYAARIMQFLENSELEIDEVEKDIVSVDRSEKNIIRISTKNKHHVNTDLLKNVLVERVMVERRA